MTVFGTADAMSNPSIWSSIIVSSAVAVVGALLYDKERSVSGNTSTFHVCVDGLKVAMFNFVAAISAVVIWWTSHGEDLFSNRMLDRIIYAKANPIAWFGISLIAYAATSVGQSSRLGEQSNDLGRNI